MAIEQITHKGKLILYVDYRGLETEAEMIGLMEELGTVLAAAPSKRLVLQNFEGTRLSPGFMDRAKVVGKASESGMLRDAMLGITGLKDILLRGYTAVTGQQALTKAFATEEEALAWLVGE